MSYYAYFDRDFFKNSGYYPLSGDHYICLLRHCFAYSSHVSFCLKSSSAVALSLIENWMVFSDPANSRATYKCCDAVLAAMSSWTTSLFEASGTDLPNCPEDPIFYREDGSIFFEAITHEGECNIYPRNDENIATLLSFGHWLLMNEDGTPDIPAKEHPLPFPPKAEIVSDPLYQALIKIHEQPALYLPSKGISELCTHVKLYRPPFLRNVKTSLPSAISCVPKWYQVFERYVLGECNAKISVDIETAILASGCAACDAFNVFFNFLKQFVALTEASQQDNVV